MLQMEKTIPTKKARQGPLGRPVLLVLLGGLALAMIAWGAVEIWGEHIDQPAAELPGAVTTTPPADTQPAPGTTQQPSGLTEPAPAQ
jgi:hypothetical protein